MNGEGLSRVAHGVVLVARVREAGICQTRFVVSATLCQTRFVVSATLYKHDLLCLPPFDLTDRSETLQQTPVLYCS